MSPDAINSALLDELRTQGDKPLDDLLARLAEERDGVRTVAKLFPLVHDVRRLSCERLEKLAASGEISKDLVDFFEADCRVPDLDWIDMDLLHAGGSFYRDRGVLGFLSLACASLPACYCWTTEAEVLGYTGKLIDRARVPRRLPETAQFVIDVVTKGAFEPEGIGIHAAHKVRLIHAIVRFLISHKDGFEAGRDTGVINPAPEVPSEPPPDRVWPHRDEAPISQELMTATLLTFHYVVLDGMRRMGIRVSSHHEQVYMHRWNVVGYFLGIDQRVLRNLSTNAEAEDVFELVMQRNRRRTDNGVALEGSLLAYMRNNIIERVLGKHLHPVVHLPPIMTRALAGKETCRALNVRLRPVEALLYVPTWFGIRLMAFLNNWRLFQRITGRFLAYVAARVWGWREQGVADDTDLYDEDSYTPGSVIVPDALAKRWHYHPKQRTADQTPSSSAK